MTRFLKPVAVAIAGVLVAGSAALVVSRMTDRNGTYEVTAYFDKAIGLFENSDVTVLGVAIGKISEVRPRGDRVMVQMEIDDEHKIPADATAQIVPISVIADRYVQFSPAYTGGPQLDDGAVLDTDRTQIPAELDDVFKQLKKLLEAIEPGEEGDPGALGNLVVQLDRALTEREDDLQGTLISAAKLTRTLARAEDDISGLLVNLDDLFGKLATRADTLGTLNANFATVMTALAESRRDLEGTITNLGEMTLEVGDLVREHRARLGRELRLAGRITSTVLENRRSIEESLAWLPVIGIGLTNAHHPAPVKSTDVRDNFSAKFCDDRPQGLPGPLQELVDEFLSELCAAVAGEPEQQQEPAAPPQPRREQQQQAPQPPAADIDPCRQAIKKVKRQLDKLEESGLSEEEEEQILRPLRKRIERLSKKCDELVEMLERHDLLDRLLEQVPDVGDIPEVDDELDATRLRGLAAGPTAAGGADDDRRSWVEGFLRFLGWAR